MAAMAILLTAASARASVPFLHAGAVGGPAKIRQLVDGSGRQVILRGVNVDGLVDYFRSDLRTPYPTDPARYAHGKCPPDDPSIEGVMTCQRDFTQMQPLGYDAIRLNLSWSLLEPTPGHISRRYLDRIAQVVGWAKHAGIYVILDMHQDAWSKFLYSTRADHCAAPYQPIKGYDGAPRWASIHTTPVCALNGTRELDPAVEEDFAKFFRNAPAPDRVGLRDHFATALAALARRFRSDPTVAGYDILNEPTYFAIGGTDDSVLLPFYGKVINSVVRHVHGFRQLFFIEPGALRDVIDRSNITSAWSRFSSYRNVVYEPHVYTRTFTPPTFPMDGGYLSAIADAHHLGLPLWVGEFGCNPADNKTVLRAHYVEQDAFGLGGALWLWKENANDINRTVYWGVYGPPFGPGIPQPARIRLTSRAYPMFVSGNLRALSYDPASGRFTMRATAGGRRARFGDTSEATVVFLPRFASRKVSAQGARVEVVPRLGGGRLVYAFPRGGPYRLSVG